MVTEGRGSRVRVVPNGVAATFHRPHPGPVAKKGAVESVRELLKNAGVTL
ncbi:MULTISPECIES: type II toxin-antitoxin system HicA family toxin [Solidesulfovibrio]|nr:MULTISPECIES: type II toxin-antitoxin system HicA family toxin [Solidesulfovibrio]MEA5089725.1 type II toxin-antitoxin system HicA family toxin [Solidesulfovibrio sp.]HML60024.1 type II toxin-antitoxin system HicA family toxin [Solidesulfovibrio sp.]